MKKLLILTIALIASCVAYAQGPVVPQAELSVYDTPDDNGVSVELEFKPVSSVEEFGRFHLDIYVDGEFKNTLDVKNAGALYINTIGTGKSGAAVKVEAFAIDADGNRVGPFLTRETQSVTQYIYSDRLRSFFWCLAFVILIVILIGQAKKGKSLFIRKIAGLDAIDDAVGRATEMGRPVFYIPGTSTIDDIATLASLNILRPVAKQIATYETPFSVPIKDPVVLTVAQDVVKEAYMAAGRIDLFEENMVYLASVGQFDYAAAVNGAMVRERPATVFLLGMFWAESLMMAETANTVGAIQIAGTDSTSQLPFFIAACDYTLIGEELYAASAYLSREPLLLGTLKAQDLIKGTLIFVLLLALVFKMMGFDFIIDLFLV